MGRFVIKSNQQAVPSLPIGKINDHEIRIKALESGGGGGSPLTVQEVDTDPTVSSVDTIVFPNGTVTDDGGGQVTIDLSSLGGGDMSKSTYDPQAIASDAFDVDNHTDGVTNKVYTATEQTKLAGIETGADVTDTANVTAAGALMDSEVTNLADVKAFDPADYTPDPVVVSGSLTAVLNTYYINVASATYTDPSPVEGKGFIVFVRNGTATVGGTGYSTAGTIVHRVYHSGSWSKYVYYDVAQLDTTYQGLDAGLTDIAGLAVTDGNIIVGDGANWVAESDATARTSLGLGTGDSPTFTGANLSGLTASTILSADGSKNISSLSTATYPSLTELSYVKGVTSAIQTQFSGKASTSQTFDWNPFFNGTVADGDYRIIINCSFGGSITEITTRSVSGTGTLTGKINTTALGGTANSVSSSEQSQSHSSANTFVAGDDIVLTVSSASSLTDMSVKIKYTRTLA